MHRMRVRRRQRMEAMKTEVPLQDDMKTKYNVTSSYSSQVDG